MLMRTVSRGFLMILRLVTIILLVQSWTGCLAEAAIIVVEHREVETDIDDVIPLAVRKVTETDVNNAQTDNSNWMEGRSPRDIIAEQEKDSDLCRIIQWIKNDQVPSEQQKRDYDTKLFQRTYDVGDANYRIDSATNVGESKKLRSPWQGPYLVIKVISPVLYRIQKRKKALVVHHDKLKPCEDKVLPKWLKYARHRLSLGVSQENEEFDIMIQDPDIGHYLSVLFQDEIPDNDLFMICSGSSGNYGQITNESPVQGVDVNNQVIDTPGSIHSPVVDAESTGACPFCVTGSAGKKECEHHYSFISRMASIERELEYDVREEIELEGNRTVVIMGKEMEVLDEMVEEDPKALSMSTVPTEGQTPSQTCIG
ncbi:Hypothetical predicted protein [Mytilus galloprovincialis]|uniref:Integrase p58-like C-terminal domain-containing protein n=1 Tax=Mytilus galloprovincialis TaxID=29158 RepID=A0A8B6BVT3_MYTGA|nr:Hypothetical predicted protein [Mytilus galloprovincialis]